MAGLGFLVYWAAAVAEAHLAKEEGMRNPTLAFAVILVGVGLFGSLRLHGAEGSGRNTTQLAAVSTDATFGANSLPNPQQLKQINETLFARTRQAARNGAKLIVWNEGATLAWPKQEKQWKEQLKALAKEVGVPVVAAYIMPVQLKPMKYENKYLWLTAQGTIEQSYLKHKPVPDYLPKTNAKDRLGKSTARCLASAKCVSSKWQPHTPRPKEAERAQEAN